MRKSCVLKKKRPHRSDLFNSSGLPWGEAGVHVDPCALEVLDGLEVALGRRVHERGGAGLALGFEHCAALVQKLDSAVLVVQRGHHHRRTARTTQRAVVKASQAMWTGMSAVPNRTKWQYRCA